MPGVPSLFWQLGDRDALAQRAGTPGSNRGRQSDRQASKVAAASPNRDEPDRMTTPRKLNRAPIKSQIGAERYEA